MKIPVFFERQLLKQQRYLFGSWYVRGGMGIISQHWGIENKLHWVLDVCFGDDDSRIRKSHATRNIAIVKKIALNLFNIVKRHKPRVSFKQMWKMVGWDQVLSAQF